MKNLRNLALLFRDYREKDILNIKKRYLDILNINIEIKKEKRKILARNIDTNTIIAFTDDSGDMFKKLDNLLDCLEKNLNKVMPPISFNDDFFSKHFSKAKRIPEVI